MIVGLLVTGPWDLGAVAQLPHILPAALLLAAERFAGSPLDPLAHLGGVPHPSVGRGLRERFFEFLSLLSSEQRPLFSARALSAHRAVPLAQISVEGARSNWRWRPIDYWARRRSGSPQRIWESGRDPSI